MSTLLEFYKILEQVVSQNDYNEIIRDTPNKLNGEKSAIYPVFSYNLQDITENDDYSVIHIRLFGIDRETNNNDNFQTILDTEIQKIQNIVRTFSTDYNIEVSGTKRFNPISDTFAYGDKCTGVVLDVNFIIPNSTLCIDTLDYRDIKII